MVESDSAKACSLPDLIQSHFGFDFENIEIGPGIQIAGAIRPTKVPRGGVAIIALFLQNALDAPVKGEIVLVPSGKEKAIATVSPISFVLDSTEVKILQIPVKASPNAESGSYRINLGLSGKGGKGGRRIRGVETITEAQIGALKSLAVSAILLPLFGVAAMYPPPLREIYFLLDVDSAISEKTLSIEVKETTLWTKTHTDIYPKVAYWVTSEFSKVQKDEKSFDRFRSSVQHKISLLTWRTQTSLSEELLYWLSLYILRRAAKEFLLGILSASISSRMVQQLQNNGRGDMQSALSDLSFENEFIDSLVSDESLTQLTSICILAYVDLSFRIVGGKRIEEGDRFDRAWLSARINELKPTFGVFFSNRPTSLEFFDRCSAAFAHLAVTTSNYIVPINEERLHHLQALRREVMGFANLNGLQGFVLREIDEVIERLSGTRVRCEYLDGTRCKSIEQDLELYDPRKEYCKNADKRFCCYLCNQKGACQISCDYFE